jgi:hypothetical protein
MGYVGVPPQSGFITTAKQRVTSSTNNYVDLDHSISSLADVIVWVNFVKQDSTNLSLTTSTRITLGGTLVSSDIVEIAYLGKAVATQNPSTNSVTNDMLAGSIANSKLANSSITLNGSAVSLGGSATVGGTNTPYFMAVNTDNFSVAHGTDTKIIFDEEISDSDNAYDTSTGRFTVPSGKGGKYYIHTKIRWNETSSWNDNEIYIHVSGANKNYMAAWWTNTKHNSMNASGILTLSDGDYVEVLVYQGSGSSKNARYIVFDGFKLIE